MFVTQKCQYALKAVFALARKDRTRPVKIAQVAEEQAIPFRFLEVILSQLKQGGFVESRRGTEGGYLLVRDPHEITVGSIVRFIDGPNFDEDIITSRKGAGGTEGDFFDSIWHEAQAAVFEVFDRTTIADLIQREEARRTSFVPNYII